MSSKKYMPPSLRKVVPDANPDMNALFSEGLVSVAEKKVSSWGNFKDALEKKDAPMAVEDKTILVSYTNPRTGATMVLRDMIKSPCDDNINIITFAPAFRHKTHAVEVTQEIDDVDSDFQSESEPESDSEPEYTSE